MSLANSEIGHQVAAEVRGLTGIEKSCGSAIPGVIGIGIMAIQKGTETETVVETETGTGTGTEMTTGGDETANHSYQIDTCTLIISATWKAFQPRSPRRTNNIIGPLATRLCMNLEQVGHVHLTPVCFRPDRQADIALQLTAFSFP